MARPAESVKGDLGRARAAIALADFWSSGLDAHRPGRGAVRWSCPAPSPSSAAPTPARQSALPAQRAPRCGTADDGAAPLPV